MSSKDAVSSTWGSQIELADGDLGFEDFFQDGLQFSSSAHIRRHAAEQERSISGDRDGIRTPRPPVPHCVPVDTASNGDQALVSSHKPWQTARCTSNAPTGRGFRASATAPRSKIVTDEASGQFRRCDPSRHSVPAPHGGQG